MHAFIAYPRLTRLVYESVILLQKVDETWFQKPTASGFKVVIESFRKKVDWLI